MKDRLVPCVSYVCCGSDCLRGVKEVTMGKCKNCKKYKPRKVSKKQEPVKVKRQKDKDRHDNWKTSY